MERDLASLVAMEQIGRYQIVKELGRGAMGVVFHAVDPTIGRSVAIKTIRLGELTDAEERSRLRERLFREARSAGILSHPGIVTIYDMEEQDGLAYIAMEFVNGPTLEQLLSNQQPIPPEQMMSFLRQTAVALDYAHQKGIVHRDIKPANIMLEGGDQVKITDFGIAKATTSDQFNVTKTIMGTPNYMSPEQVQGLAIDGRADQFALCVIAYEMLTGERPFTGEHLTTVVYKIVAEEPPPPHRINPTLGPKIESVLKKGLAKKPEARYATCVEFAGALNAACAATAGWKNLPRGGSLSLPTELEVTLPDVPPAAAPAPAPADRAGAPRSRKLLPFAAALVVVGALAGLIAWQVGSRTQPPVPPLAVEKKQEPPIAEIPSDQKKPSPLEPTVAAPEEKPPEPQPRRQVEAPAPREAKLQDVWVPTEPPGAHAVLDGRPETTCKTPCILLAGPGRHVVSVSLDGYHAERREIQVGEGSQDLGKIVFRQIGGTLMLSTSPAGASIEVDGRAFSQSTPARIELPAGTHSLSVQKDGKKVTEQVEIRNGVTNYLKIPLPQ